MKSAAVREFVERLWNKSIVPTLMEYIRIPNKSPMFDSEWQDHGHMDRALTLIDRWCRAQPVDKLKLETVRLPGRTPLLFMEVEGSSPDCVLLYGHFDKQPEMSGWREGLGPWHPVLENERLYGRGGADDGYAVFASIAAIMALREQRIPHARCVILIEGCEESGSYDLPHYIDALANRIGVPGLVVCLDSGCGNYDQLWCTTSLRGLVSGNLTVQVLKEGVHSGDGSGIAPSTFRILRALLSRLEDEETGEILPREFHVTSPQRRVDEAAALAGILGKDVYEKLPFLEGVKPVASGNLDLILNRTWRPMLAITGAAGLPPLENAGNVLRPMTSVRVSLRVPPTCDVKVAGARLKDLFESDPPYGAHVLFDLQQCASGWNAPEASGWLLKSADKASLDFFGSPAAYMGEGGSIPFMSMLGEKYPNAQFLITGVLGPHSNAHGPNEFLHIPTAIKLTCCVAQLLADHFKAGHPEKS
jgi:acetylornithine deacetylase/succinyl-diaminopimelate desuccinylase-like protein